MTILFAGEVAVQYRFINVHPKGDPPSGVDVRGQSNGLCGAPEPGVLSLTTGLHTGDVPLVVEVFAMAPPQEDCWEEVVEVSMVADTTAYELTAFDTQQPLTLPAVGCYRARLNASGVDMAGDVAVRRSGEPVLDFYRLQLWPAPAQLGAIIRQTSQLAGLWHRTARGEDLA